MIIIQEVTDHMGAWNKRSYLACDFSLIWIVFSISPETLQDLEKVSYLLNRLVLLYHLKKSVYAFRKGKSSNWSIFTMTSSMEIKAKELTFYLIHVQSVLIWGWWQLFNKHLACSKTTSVTTIGRCKIPREFKTPKPPSPKKRIGTKKMLLQNILSCI